LTSMSANNFDAQRELYVMLIPKDDHTFTRRYSFSNRLRQNRRLCCVGQEQDGLIAQMHGLVLDLDSRVDKTIGFWLLPPDMDQGAQELTVSVQLCSG